MRSDDALAQMIGEKLRAIRGQETLDAFLARVRALGLIAPKWNRYEKGAETPSTPKIVDICQKLQISADWLLLDMSFKPEDIEAVSHAGLVRLWQESKPRPTEAIEEAIKSYEPRSPGSADVPDVPTKVASIAGKGAAAPLPVSRPRHPRHPRRRRKK